MNDSRDDIFQVGVMAVIAYQARRGDAERGAHSVQQGFGVERL